MKFDKSYFKNILGEAPLNLGQINYPTTKQVIAIQKYLRTEAPEVLKDYRRLIKKLQSSFVSGKELVYIRDEPDADYRKQTGIGDSHRIEIRKKTQSPLGKEVVASKGTTETTYETVLAIKEEYIPEAIYKKKIGVQGIRDIKKGTPPYTVVAMKGKKVVDQSKPAMVSTQVPAIIYDFLEKHGKNDSLTIGVEDKGGELVYTYYKPFSVGEEYIPEGGLGGSHKMAKGRIGVSPSHAKKYRDDRGSPGRDSRGSKFEPSKDRDARGGRWDGNDYTMSKKDYARLHKDFKSKIKGKPYATAMDPKTGATILTPVIITEKRGAEDPYTVKYWYDKQGRKMWATLSGKADATKFLKNVKGLGMGGVIIKGDVREETIAAVTERTKQAKFAQGNRPGDASDPYTVKYSYTKTGRIMVATLASKKDAETFLKNVKGLGMRGIIVKGAAKEEFAVEAHLKQKFSHGNLPIKDHEEERKFKNSLRAKFSETPNACSKKRHEESAADDDIDERAGANRLGGVLMVRTMKQDDGSYKWILQRIEGSPGSKAKTTQVDSGTEDSRSKADRAGQKAKKKMKANEEYIAGLKESVDTAIVDELVLYITNDGQLYRQRATPIIKNLSKKVGDATYDGLKAIKAFMYLATDGIKKYEKEFGSKLMMDKRTKQAIAEALLDHYSAEIGE